MKHEMKKKVIVGLLIITNLLIFTTFIPLTTSKPLPNNPPYTPSNPHPPDGATNVSLNYIHLSFTDGDPDGDPVTFDLSFGATNPPPMIYSNITGSDFILPPQIPYNTTYYWKIVSWDIHGASAEGPIWSFTTVDNSPPYAPGNPYPPDGATNVSLNTNLSWNCSDPYQDFLAYDVCLGTINPPIKVTSNQTKTTYHPFTTLNPLTTYYWKIIAWDTYGLSNESDVWMFTTKENSPPYEPSNPYPPNGSTGSLGGGSIHWTGGDPDGDPVTYDVYFGTIDTPSLLVSNITDPGFLYLPGWLEDNTTYYWKIVAWDNHGASTRGPLWWFRTPKFLKPDLYSEGGFSWMKIKPGSTVTGCFFVINIGEPESLLNWEITGYPSWGNWTFDPKQGDSLTPERGPVTVNVTVIVPNKRNQEFTGVITIVNTDNASDNGIIQVTLKTPASIQPARFSLVYSFLHQLLERFPKAFPLLRLLSTRG